MELASKTSPRAAREYGLLLTNQAEPHLNEPDRGLEYLRVAASNGDGDASQALAKLQAASGAASAATQYAEQHPPSVADRDEALANLTLKDRAMRGNPDDMYEYAQEISLRRIRVEEPEFTAYCWMSVAAQLGSRKASAELVFVQGVKTISDRKQPGRLDQCIRDLHYQVRGEN